MTSKRLLVRFLSAALLPLFFSGVVPLLQAQQGGFTGQMTGLQTPLFGPAVHFVDLDSDSDDDAVVQDSDNDRLLLYYNDGQGNYSQSPTPVQTPLTPSTGSFALLAIADITADGLPDIIGSHRTSTTQTRMWVRVQDSNGGWLPSSIASSTWGTALIPLEQYNGLTVPLSSGMKVADVDQDGHADLVGHFGYSGQALDSKCLLCVLYGDSSGTADSFFNHSRKVYWRLTASGQPETRLLALEDMDNDGLIDIVLQQIFIRPTHSGFRPYVGVMRGVGNRLFLPFTASQIGAHEVIENLVDVDRDGFLDITRYSAGGLLSSHSMNSQGAWAPLNTQTIADPTATTNHKWIDYENDGDFDLVGTARLSGTSPGTLVAVILQNNGQGTIEPSSADTQFVTSIPAPIFGVNHYAIVNLDNDGISDLIYSGSGASFTVNWFGLKQTPGVTVPYRGSNEDLALYVGLNSSPGHLFKRSLQGPAQINIDLQSPVGTFALSGFMVGASVRPSWISAPAQVPHIHLDLANLIVLHSSASQGPLNAILGSGFSASLMVDAPTATLLGSTGSFLTIQAAAFSPNAANGSYATTHGFEIEFR